MIHNIGPTDRVLRAALIAPVLVAAAVLVGVTTVAGLVLLGVAVAMLATSALGFCPLYRLLGIDTRRRVGTR